MVVMAAVALAAEHRVHSAVAPALQITMRLALRGEAEFGTAASTELARSKQQAVCL